MIAESERQTVIDDEHLKLLRIGFFVSAGESACFAMFGAFYAGMGLMMNAMFKHMPKSPQSPPPPPEVMWFFGAIGGVMFAVFFAMAVLKLYVGKCIRLRQSRNFVLVMALLICLGVPYGTVLGICALLVLARPSVKQLFLGPIA